jgi:hypothetical protein
VEAALLLLCLLCLLLLSSLQSSAELSVGAQQRLAKLTGAVQVQLQLRTGSPEALALLRCHLRCQRCLRLRCCQSAPQLCLTAAHRGQGGPELTGAGAGDCS